MALLQGIKHAKQIVRKSVSGLAKNVPKGYFAVYAGEDQKKRFAVPGSYLNEPSFQELLRKAGEEFGFDHPMGGITIPCREDVFTDLISHFNAFQREVIELDQTGIVQNSCISSQSVEEKS